ncbi:MAG: cupin domain-containing protein [Planctomycetota bacterium]|jgi:mannose-6-phosphate isomerase-like protein (cupin superfamily)
MKQSIAIWMAPVVALVVAGCDSTPTAPRPVVIMEPQAGDHLWSFHASGEALGSGGELQIFLDHETHPEAKASFAKFTLGVGGALPVHRHDKTEEFAYILSGDGAAVTIGDDGEEIEVPISAGYFWYNPPGAWHAVRNQGTTPLALIFATVPNEEKGLLSFFRRISVEPGEEPIVLAPEDMERLGAEHDLILRPPPQGK